MRSSLPALNTPASNTRNPTFPTARTSPTNISKDLDDATPRASTLNPPSTTTTTTTSPSQEITPRGPIRAAYNRANATSPSSSTSNSTANPNIITIGIKNPIVIDMDAPPMSIVERAKEYPPFDWRRTKLPDAPWPKGHMRYRDPNRKDPPGGGTAGSVSRGGGGAAAASGRGGRV